tara:strand:- start:3716 stop:4120 length:405 start_codon:yes stop_codon:yes gene_type:complete
MDIDKAYILSAFNDQFTEFVEDVERVFPNDVQIRTCKNALFALRKTNPKLIFTSLSEYLLKYKTQIENKNINFFINKDYDNDMLEKQVNTEKSKKILDKIDSLRVPIKKMNDYEKEKIITYMQNLLKLCEIYNL